LAGAEARPGGRRTTALGRGRAGRDGLDGGHAPAGGGRRARGRTSALPCPDHRAGRPRTVVRKPGVGGLVEARVRRPGGDPERVSSEATRFVVGIDLGTTNSAVACVDTLRADRDVEDVPLPQLVAPGRVESRDTLPSFHYQPAAGELPADALRLPWHAGEPDHAVGVFARDHGAAVPGRLIASAKSWLSHAGVDRTAPPLPSPR